MSKIGGVFEEFKDLDQIPIEDFATWLKSTPPPYYLENYLANKILYPQSAPVTDFDAEADLAILREVLKRDHRFFDEKKGRILIPKNFIGRFSSLPRIVWAYIDAFKPKDITRVILLENGKQLIVGSIINPQFSVSTPGGKNFLQLSVEGRNYLIKENSLTIIPCVKERCHINFKSENAKISGKKQDFIEISGGELGLVVDGRRK
ncbi:hypothetical protein HY387_00555 [Candidatus Daviesbacteria bacterium]|nr:hypothetical protein [Candidatus Daviesbacteria bacterium]